MIKFTYSTILVYSIHLLFCTSIPCILHDTTLILVNPLRHYLTQLHDCQAHPAPVHLLLLD
jgi:hypothetical protein